MSDNNNEVTTLSDNPNKLLLWIALLVRPRLTMRELLEKETAQSAWNLWIIFTIVLVVATPIIGYLQNAFWGVPNLKFIEWLFAIPFIVIINLLLFYFESYLFWKTSIWLGGRCEKHEMRIVLAWSTTIPFLVFSSVDTILMLLLGNENLLVMIVSNVGAIWGIAIVIAGIREVTNLSIWRAGVVWVSPYLVILGGILSIIVTLGLIFWLAMKIF